MLTISFNSASGRRVCRVRLRRLHRAESDVIDGVDVRGRAADRRSALSQHELRLEPFYLRRATAPGRRDGAEIRPQPPQLRRPRAYAPQQQVCAAVRDKIGTLNSRGAGGLRPGAVGSASPEYRHDFTLDVILRWASRQRGPKRTTPRRVSYPYVYATMIGDQSVPDADFARSEGWSRRSSGRPHSLWRNGEHRSRPSRASGSANCAAPRRDRAGRQRSHCGLSSNGARARAARPGRS